MADREFYISYIRSLLPYMSERHLEITRGFLDGLCGGYRADWSMAERDRPVLTMEEQRQADQATHAMRSIGLSICPDMCGEFCITGRDAVTADAIGFLDDDVIVMDVKKIVEAWKQNSEKRIKKDTLLQYMEKAGYVLPRKKKHKTIVVNGERREVVYVPVTKLRPFIRDDYEVRCIREVLV